MALPFIAGAILGGLAVAAFNNKDKIKSTLESGLDKGKEFAENAKEAKQKSTPRKNLLKQAKRRPKQKNAQDALAPK